MTNLKRLTLLLVLLPVLLQAKVPEWVQSIPTNSFYYWGIGVSELLNPNYKEVAKREALEEITQQIAVKVESNSFMNMAELDLVAHEDYQKQIQASSQVYLEDLQIFDSYQDKKNYYVCYRLNKEEYRSKIKEKGLEVAKVAYEYLQQARNAELEGKLISSIAYYEKGLEEVQPWLFLDLSFMSENVPVALYAGYMSIFDGLALTLQPISADVQNLTAVNIEIVASLHKNNTPIRDFPLQANFENGKGKITTTTKTNTMGEGHFYLTQLTSKEAFQSIKIRVDNSVLKDLPRIYQNTTTSRKLPEAIFRVNVAQQNLVFYLNPINNAIPPLLRQISSILTSEYFDVTTNMYDATHIIDIATDLKKTGSVKGELENLDEWLASLNIALRDKNSSILTHYAEEGVRILVPENSSKAVATQQASKELVQRFKRNFPKRLEQMSIH